MTKKTKIIISTLLTLIIVMVIIGFIYSSPVIKLTGEEIKEEECVKSQLNIPKTRAVSRGTNEVIYYNIPLEKKLQRLIWHQSNKYRLSYELILSIIFVESGYQNNAVGNAGSIGLMQLHSSTYPWIVNELGVNSFDPCDSKHNIVVGIWYLNYLRGHWSELGYCDEDVFALMLCAYNRGIEGCNQYRQHNNVYENDYVQKVYNYKCKLEQGEI